MTYAIERAIDEIERRGIRKGTKEGEIKVAIAMIDEGLPIETASKCSGIPADEIMQSIKKRKPQ
jgi:hypothetical protein